MRNGHWRSIEAKQYVFYAKYIHFFRRVGMMPLEQRPQARRHLFYQHPVALGKIRLPYPLKGVFRPGPPIYLGKFLQLLI